ncbi:hypothetical protein [Qipengyuania soli]|uniref:Uncharacterized protein n=1 Tax=Qipengyuania soli TaxID=2782568 RepID=A0A7S8F3C9_9SPHN|nr:hypothetical protein [Qipengyuania soli]QPC98320.1 hypothetical protein IRL76_10700 [Qipengyuania soli]
MIKRGILPFALGAIVIMSAGSVQAQDAAETAVILSGAPAQQSGARSLGDAISGAMGQVGEEIRASRSSNGSSGPVYAPSRRGGGGTTTTYFPMGGPVEADALAHAEVATYRLENGVRMRVSGTFLPSGTTVCEAFCPGG